MLFAGANPYTITGTTGIANSASAGSTVFNNQTSNTVTIAAPILANGANTVAFTGPGTTALTGVSTYTGATTIATGSTLQIGGGGATGSLSATTAILDNGALAFDRNDTALSIGNTISGSGSVQQTGSGTTTLTGPNTYTGATNIAAGTLALSGSGILPAATTVNFTGTSTLNVGSTSQTITGLTATAALTGTISGSGGSLTVTGGAFTVGGTVSGTNITTLNASGLSTFVYNNSSATFQVVGDGNSNAGGSSTLELAQTSTITASSFLVGGSAISGTYGTSVPTAEVDAGQTTTINATSIVTDSNNEGGKLTFQAGLTNPTLTLAGTAGGSSRRDESLRGREQRRRPERGAYVHVRHDRRNAHGQQGYDPVRGR